MKITGLRPEDFERDMYIVKSNDLIQRSRYTLSYEEQRILLYLISKIKPTDKEIKRQDIDIKEYCKTCGININDVPCMYAFIKRTVKSLADKSFWIKIEDNKETLLRWIDKATINKNEGIINVRLCEDLLPYLIQVKKNYTQYTLASVLAMKSKYSPRLYEILLSYLYLYRGFNETHKEYDIIELMELLGITEKTKETYLKNVSMFKKNVIEKAVEEINYYTELKIDVEYKKEKKKIKTIRFNIYRRNWDESWTNANHAYNELDGENNNAK